MYLLFSAVISYQLDGLAQLYSNIRHILVAMYIYMYVRCSIIYTYPMVYKYVCTLFFYVYTICTNVPVRISRETMTRHSSTTTKPHSLLLQDMYYQTLDLDKCTLQEGK